MAVDRKCVMPLRSRPPPRDHSKRFTAVVLDPEAWKSSARALVEAAELLEPKINEFWQGVRTETSWNDGGVAVYFMLCSFALENLLKARIVEKRRSELAHALRSCPTLPNELKEHNLYRLMRKAGLDVLAAEEESLLHRLSRSAVWYGRYPVPVTGAALASFRKSEHKDFEIILNQYSSADCHDIKRMLRDVG
jgi:hypothetical protein